MSNDISDSKYVVWEWQEDGFSWLPYKSEVSNFIEDSFIKKIKKVSLKVIDPKLSYSLDLKINKQISSSGVSRGIRRFCYPLSNTLSNNISWMWLGNDGQQWNIYPIEISDDLEKSYQRKSKCFNLRISLQNYVVDFQTMVQKNIITGYERNVQRTIYDIPYKMTAQQSNGNGLNNSSSATQNFSNGQSTSVQSRQMIFTRSKTSLGKRTRTTNVNNYVNNFKSSTNNASSSRGDRFKKRSRTKEVDGVKQIDVLTNEGETKFTSLKKFMIFLDSSMCQNEDCCICCDSLKNVSSFPADDDESCEDNPNRVIKLHKCSHVFHYNCLLAMYNSGKKEGSIQCPSCKYIYGIKYGDCPSGSMTYEILNNCSLSGYPDCGVIKITYDIKNGIQESFHPNPGKQYTASGFPRYGYLPHNLDGLKILQLLKKAWFRRLTFTIGTSVTTGRANVVVWNEIHHKTEMDNKSGHGYPDPEYLNNVTKELTFHGVVEKDDDELEYND